MNKIMIIIIVLITLLSMLYTKNKTSNLKFEYNRLEVLDTLIYTLNEINDPYSWYGDDDGFRYFDDDGLISLFAIVDLSDTTNKETPKVNKKIIFLENHVYHFYPIFTEMFYKSGILVLHNGNYNVYHSLNCENEDGSKLEDVITFISDSLHNIEDKDVLIERVLNYNDYNDYFIFFNPINFNCDSDGNDN